MRELVLDTETTGLDHENGDRIVEIGIIELHNHVRTGNQLQYYINPERKSDPKAEKIHGLTSEYLSNKPKFNEVAENIIEFIGDSNIIIHNAKFDVGFLNSELSRCNLKELKDENVIDTLYLARKQFPGQSVSLDSLCKRFHIDISNRKIHGAILDANLLALVYLELKGGKQASLQFINISNDTINDDDHNISNLNDVYLEKKVKKIQNINIDHQDYDKHKEFIKNIPNSIWSKLKN